MLCLMPLCNSFVPASRGSLHDHVRLQEIVECRGKIAMGTVTVTPMISRYDMLTAGYQQFTFDLPRKSKNADSSAQTWKYE